MRRAGARGGLTQPALAALLGVSVTTVGHAETGRAWQAREFWRRADAALGGAGHLLRMFERYKAAEYAAPEEVGDTAPEDTVPSGPVLPVSVTITPDGVAVVWPDGTETLTRPPGWEDRPSSAKDRVSDVDFSMRPG